MHNSPTLDLGDMGGDGRNHAVHIFSCGPVRADFDGGGGGSGEGDRSRGVGGGVGWKRLGPPTPVVTSFCLKNSTRVSRDWTN